MLCVGGCVGSCPKSKLSVCLSRVRVCYRRQPSLASWSYAALPSFKNQRRVTAKLIGGSSVRYASEAELATTSRDRWHHL